MHHAVVHLQGSSVQVRIVQSDAAPTTTVAASESPTTTAGGASPTETPTAETTVPDYSKPGPILPELKELYWGGGSFVVFALLMRFVLFPKLKKGMDARYHGIRNAHESADAERASARSEVAEYEAQLAAIKADAARTVEAARNTVEAERTDQLATLNARLAQQRAAAAAEAEAARAAAQAQIEAAVSDVAGRAGELATGRRPSPEVVSRVVREVMAR